MNKKLPNLYVNKIEKKMINNDTVFYSALIDKPKLKKEEGIRASDIVEYTVEDKITELFNSSNYVYKMNVTITLKDMTVINKDIIGKSGNRLITIDEDLIDINDIRDIKF